VGIAHGLRLRTRTHTAAATMHRLQTAERDPRGLSEGLGPKRGVQGGAQWASRRARRPRPQRGWRCRIKRVLNASAQPHEIRVSNGQHITSDEPMCLQYLLVADK
jgi:hypothetical protein